MLEKFVEGWRMLEKFGEVCRSLGSLEKFGEGWGSLEKVEKSCRSLENVGEV